MTDIARALVESLDCDALDRLAALLGPRITQPDHPEPWLDVDGAARHLACDRRRIYDLVSSRESTGFPIHRDGRRLLFRPSELDEWVTGTAASIHVRTRPKGGRHE